MPHFPYKSVQIFNLTKSKPWLTSFQIGRQLKCNPAYVRVIWQRRKLPKRCPSNQERRGMAAT
jgi:hypothetical protein